MQTTDFKIYFAILPRFDLIKPQSEQNTSRLPLIHRKTAVCSNQQANVGRLHPVKTRQPSAFSGRLQSPTAAQVMCKAEESQIERCIQS